MSTNASTPDPTAGEHESADVIRSVTRAMRASDGRCPDDGQSAEWHLHVGGTHYDGSPRTNGEFVGCDFGAADRPATPPAEAASTPASEPNIVQRIVNAWDYCGTCAGGVLASYVAARVADAEAKARADERERIAQDIEAVARKHPNHPCDCRGCSAFRYAARIARGDA